MSAQPKDLYGKDNTVAFRDALRYAQDTRADKDRRGEVTREDVKEALCALCDDPAWLDRLRNDYRDEDKMEIGRWVTLQIDIQRALRLRQAMP